MRDQDMRYYSYFKDVQKYSVWLHEAETAVFRSDHWMIPETKKA